MIAPRQEPFTTGGLDARELADRFGTPLFVYDAEVVRATYRRLRAAFTYAPLRVHFAAVCNPNLAVLRLFRGEGAGIHANTPGDVHCALAAGFGPEDIVFSGTNLGEADLEYLLAAGVHVNVDSLDDLDRATRMGERRAFGLRVHLDEVLAESRVGLREREVHAAVALAAVRGCRLTALHVYCGTHGRSTERYVAALRRLAELAPALPDLVQINLGGGFGYDYTDEHDGTFPFEELAAPVDATMRALSERLGRALLLRLEPGRTLVAAAGVLLTRVRSVKQGARVRYVGVDTTVANFTSPIVHGAHRRVVAVDAREATDVPADVCGATTFSRDFVARDARLPAVAVGDLLAVLDTGAYGACMASDFLNRPRAAEVMVDAGVAKLVARRQTMADLLARQRWDDAAE